MSNLSNERFDYSALDSSTASLAKESAIEIKAREKAIWENIIEIGNKLIEVKTALPHGSFQHWVKIEFNWSYQVANKYMKVSKEIGAKFSYKRDLDSSLNSLYALASGLSKSDEETKEQIMEAVESKTEEKGKALTEKEIKEITAKVRSDYELKLHDAESKLKKVQSELGVTQIELEEAQKNYYDQLDETIKLESKLKFNQEKLDAQNQAIEELEETKQKFFIEQLNLAEQKKILNDKLAETETLIDKKARLIAQEQLEKEQVKLDRQKKELEEKVKEAEKQLKEARKLKNDAEVEAYRINNVVGWMDCLENFTQNLNENAIEIAKAVNKLDSLPQLEALAKEDLEAIKPRAISLFDDYEKAQIEYSKAVMKINRICQKLNLNSFGETIEAEVIIPKSK